MGFLFSDRPPLNKLNYPSFYSKFYELLGKYDKLNIAVGYVTADALIDLKNIIMQNSSKSINLLIGMHYIDKFTNSEYKAAMNLNDYLIDNQCGEIRLVIPFRFHGKLYSYCNNEGSFCGIIGSDNLSSISDSKGNIFEASYCIENSSEAKKIYDFIQELKNKASKNIREVEINSFKKEYSPLEADNLAKRLNPSEFSAICKRINKDISFEIPIDGNSRKTKSNLNIYFGKGRLSSNNVVKPRHWYEVEIIVPKKISCSVNYPKCSENKPSFTVFTDDMWSFECSTNGSYCKNFRSSGDLKTLGRWIKGRLEDKNLLSVGDYITDEMLEEYGRKTISLTKIDDDNWYMDFGVEK